MKISLMTRFAVCRLSLRSFSSSLEKLSKIEKNGLFEVPSIRAISSIYKVAERNFWTKTTARKSGSEQK